MFPSLKPGRQLHRRLEVQVYSSSVHQTTFEARVQFTLTAALRESYVASDFLQSISGKILACTEDELELRAGHITASLVQFGRAIDHGVMPDQLGDGITGDVAEYWEKLYNVKSGEWKEVIRDSFEIVGSDLLAIDCIEIYPRFRGHQIGLLAVDRAIDIFSPGCGLVVRKPWPLQFTPAFVTGRRRMQRLQVSNISEIEAVQKLRSYWSKAGFRPVGETGLYGLSVAQRR
jgi:hypothetical protein